MSDYKKTFSVNCRADRIYQAITTEMGLWWSTTSNTFLHIGDTAKVTFPGLQTYWVFRAIELDAPNRVVLQCVESHHVYIGKTKEILTEWLNTKLIFNIEEKDGVAVVYFRHAGLTRNLRCYSDCQQGWDHFIGVSLKRHLEIYPVWKSSGQ